MEKLIQKDQMTLGKAHRAGGEIERENKEGGGTASGKKDAFAGEKNRVAPLQQMAIWRLRLVFVILCDDKRQYVLFSVVCPP